MWGSLKRLVMSVAVLVGFAVVPVLVPTSAHAVSAGCSLFNGSTSGTAGSSDLAAALDTPGHVAFDMGDKVTASATGPAGSTLTIFVNDVGVAGPVSVPGQVSYTFPSAESAHVLANLVFGGTGPFSITISCGETPVTALSASVFVGLKNSDDVGTKFDLQGVVKKGADVVGTGTLSGVNGASSGVSAALLRTIAISGSTAVVSGDQLSLELSARISCSAPGHASGTARLFYDDAIANSRLALTMGGTPETLYLHAATPQLSETVGAGPRQTADAFVNSAVACATPRPYTPIKTFTMTVA
jgi:hypothetical protein